MSPGLAHLKEGIVDDFGVIIPSVSLGGSPKEGIKAVFKLDV